MNATPTVLDFIKAVSDADRLRIIGLLAQRPASIKEVCASLELPFRKAFNHMAMLEFAGVIHKDGELFTLDEGAMEQLSHQELAPRFAPDPLPADLDDKARKVLSGFLKPSVPHRQLPAQESKLRVVLAYIVTAFEPDTNYTERQVNEILRRFHPDSASVRRYLVDAGLLGRESDGSRYWREPRTGDR